MTLYQKKSQVNITFNVTEKGNDSVLGPAFNDLAAIRESRLIADFKIGVRGGDEENGMRGGEFMLADVLQELNRYMSAQANINQTTLDPQSAYDAQGAFIVLMNILDDKGLQDSTITVEDATETSIFMDGTWPTDKLLLSLGKIIDIAVMAHAPEEQLKHLGVFG